MRLLLLLAALLPLPASALEQVALQLKWKHQFQFAGYYAAQEKGYYRDAGLEVSVIEAGPETDPVREVLDGRAQFGVSNSALLLARAQGKPVVALAVIFQHSPFILAARRDGGIRSVHDLAGVECVQCRCPVPVLNSLFYSIFRPGFFFIFYLYICCDKSRHVIG